LGIAIRLLLLLGVVVRHCDRRFVLLSLDALDSLFNRESCLLSPSLCQDPPQSASLPTINPQGTPWLFTRSLISLAVSIKHSRKSHIKTGQEVKRKEIMIRCRSYYHTAISKECVRPKQDYFRSIIKSQTLPTHFLKTTLPSAALAVTRVVSATVTAMT
jgi:hypothetical protein